jgi:hypothetical protein
MDTPPQSVPVPLPPPGWYPDPNPGALGHRYWDGQIWTDHTLAPPPPSYPFIAPQRGMNGMAIASMVLGIVWIYGLGSILALIFGYVALRQITQRDERGRGMAIAGVVLGWVGIVGMILFVVLIVIAIHHPVQCYTNSNGIYACYRG